MDKKLQERSGGQCELCKSSEGISVYAVSPPTRSGNEIVICGACQAQITGKAAPDSSYWHFLSETMWSEVPAVQVTAWRMLNRFKTESWAADNLDMFYLDDDLSEWAKAEGEPDAPLETEIHKDSLGNILQNGDTVVLTKSLDVKGSTLNARMGTVVKNIRLVENNSGQIEGKIDGQLLVILTKYLRKQN